MIRLTLYGTLGCHLCDEAQAILDEASRTGLMLFEVQYIDIATDTALADHYGTRIPVVRDTHSGEELGWPFDIQDVTGFLSGSA